MVMFMILTPSHGAGWLKRRGRRFSPRPSTKVVLVSGDGDYFKLVDYLIAKKRFVKLLAPSKHAISSLYRRIPDRYRDFLDNTSVQSKIAYKKRQTKKQVRLR